MSSSCLGWHRDNGMNFVTLFSALSLTYLSGCVMHEVHDSRLLLKEILTTCNRIFGVNSDLYFIELVEFLYNWSALIALHFANWRKKAWILPKFNTNLVEIILSCIWEIWALSFSAWPAALHHNNRQPLHVMSNHNPFKAHPTLSTLSQPQQITH